MRIRRQVLKSFCFGVVWGVMSLQGSGQTLPLPEDGGMREDVLRRVERAMLSMQRASWEHGVAAQAFVEQGNDAMVILMAREAVLRQTEEGRLAVLYTDNGVTDPAAAGEAVMHAARITGDPALKAAAERMLGYLMEGAPRAPDGVLHHTVKEPEIWVDSMYMAPPFLAVAGEYDEAVRQIRGIRKVLWNEASRLYSHRWDTEREEFINPKFWGVGNGWVAAAMCRVLAVLPESMEAERAELIGYLEDLLRACMKYKRPDHLFHDVLDDPSSFVETNLSQMLAYSIFRAVQAGWIDPGWLDDGEAMREAAWGKIDADGYVQGVCGAPFFNSPGRATEGQAFFLLMEAAWEDLDPQYRMDARNP